VRAALRWQGAALMPGTWKNRSALHLRNDALEVTVLASGGHIASLRCVGDPRAANMLWEAPWPTEDIGTPLHQQLVEDYGGGPTGVFFAGWTGHALCLDLFGAPDDGEASQGMPLHGEAASTAWDVIEANDYRCKMSVMLPIAALAVQRTFQLSPDEAVLYCTEDVVNHRDTERPVHWVQHVTLGPSFLEAGGARIGTSARRGITWPLGYEGKPALADDTEFEFPMAPCAVNPDEQHDLRRPFQGSNTGFVVGLLNPPEEEFSWVTIVNPVAQALLAYVFRREDFPWLAIWEENGAREYKPWNGNTQVCGLEFGTTPLPLGRSDTRLRPSLFHTPTERLIGAGESVQARWVAIATESSPDWQKIESLLVKEDGVELTEGAKTRTVPACGIRRFLRGESVS